jgi:hypothetical protein
MTRSRSFTVLQILEHTTITTFCPRHRDQLHLTNSEQQPSTFVEFMEEGQTIGRDL